MASRYWQHNDPLKCPKGHAMIWLGLVFWICPRCPKRKQLWVERREERPDGE